MRLNDSGVGCGCHMQGIGCSGGHNDQSAVRLDKSLVLDKGINCTLINRVADKSVAGEIKRNLVAGGKKDAAAVGCYAPFVGDFWCHEGNNPTIKGIDDALIEESARASGAGEGIFACKKVAVEHVE